MSKGMGLDKGKRLMGFECAFRDNHNEHNGKNMGVNNRGRRLVGGSSSSLGQ